MFGTLTSILGLGFEDIQCVTPVVSILRKVVAGGMEPSITDEHCLYDFEVNICALLLLGLVFFIFLTLV